MKPSHPRPATARVQPEAQLAPYRCERCLTLVPANRLRTRCVACGGRRKPGTEPHRTDPTLLQIGERLRSPTVDQPSLRLLLQALSGARYYVHFLSYGLSPEFIGALNMAAMRIPVNGVVSNADPALCAALRHASVQVPQFNTRCLAAPTTWTASPHERLVVIDGVLALRGRVSLTMRSWHDHSLRDRCGVSVEMDPRRVAKLNNQHFVPLWTGQKGNAPSERPSLDSAA